MHPTIPTQRFFFYKGIWTQKLDQLLLSHVIRNQGSQRWARNAIPNFVMNLALESVIKEGKATQLCFDDVKLRLDALKARYTLFSEIIATRGVRWIVHQNIVIADEIVWSKLLKVFHCNSVYYNFDERNINLYKSHSLMHALYVYWLWLFQKNPLAGAYYYRDEPHYSLLATIWGALDIDVDDETMIIVSSDTSTELIGNFHGPYAASPADPDEVNSPCVRHGPKAKRKLFVDEAEIGDRQSSTAAPRRIAPAQMNLPKFSPGGSSSASCIPFPGSRKTAP